MRLAGFLLLLAPGCAADPEPAMDTAVTFHRDIRPILDASCLSCHSAGGVAPMSFEAEADVVAWQAAIVDAVVSRTMPPWAMEPDCRSTVGDLRLPDEDVARFQAWADGGYAAGDPADYVPATPPVVEVTPPDLALYPAEPYTPDNTSPDDYRCQLLDAEFPDTVFVTSGEALPDQIGQVHHVIAYVVTPAGLAEVAERDAEDALPGYACFGGPGVAGAAVIGGWAPGAQHDERPVLVDGGIAAARIPAGSGILLEVHYNTAAVLQVQPDLTGFAMYTLPPGQTPEWLSWALAIADLGLDVPAGDPASEQGITTRVPIDGRVIGSAPHMHLRGTSLETRVIREDGTEVCLSDAPDYDFDWQRQYKYTPEHQVPLSVTDEIAIRCVYDNSAANQPDGGEPRDLAWGEGTGDEMCLDYLTVATPYAGGDDPSVCAGFEGCYEACAPDDAFCFMACATQAGEGCQYCSYDALFGACVTYDHCLTEGTALYVCTLGCDDMESDYADCLYDDCRAEFDAYYSCFQPVFDSGACQDADLAHCPGMSP